MKVLGKVFLALIVIALLAVAGVYFYLSSDPYKDSYDDYKGYRSDNLVITDYLAYDKDTTDLTLSINKNFLYSVIDVEKIIEDLESNYEVNVESVGLELVDDTNDVNVYIAAKYKNAIPVHLKAKGDFIYDKFTVTISLNEIEVGNKITLDQQFLQENLGLDTFEYTYAIDDGVISDLFDTLQFDRDLFDLDPVKDNTLVLRVNIREYAYNSIVRLVDSIDDHRIRDTFFKSNGSIENAAAKSFSVLQQKILKALD